MKTFWCILCMLLLAAFNQPQGLDRKIHGTVFSIDTGDPLQGVLVEVEGTKIRVRTDIEGKYELITSGNPILIFSFSGFVTQKLELGTRTELNVGLSPKVDVLEEMTVEFDMESPNMSQERLYGAGAPASKMRAMADGFYENSGYHNTEEYDFISENIFHSPRVQPLSTFSIDVDGASYSNVRRMLKRPIEAAKAGSSSSARSNMRRDSRLPSFV